MQSLIEYPIQEIDLERKEVFECSQDAPSIACKVKLRYPSGKFLNASVLVHNPITDEIIGEQKYENPNSDSEQEDPSTVKLEFSVDTFYNGDIGSAKDLIRKVVDLMRKVQTYEVDQQEDLLLEHLGYLFEPLVPVFTSLSVTLNDVSAQVEAVSK
jgi:tRNA uridine 5-carbamoylmethylation protein Kti12